MNITETDFKESDFLTKELYINATTAPSKFNELIYKNRDDVLILDHKFFEPCFSVDPLCTIDDDSIMDHKHELSWFNGFMKWLAQFVIILIYVLLGVFLPVCMFLLAFWFMKKGAIKSGLKSVRIK
jgi:hypothetical protein